MEERKPSRILEVLSSRVVKFDRILQNWKQFCRTSRMILQNFSYSAKLLVWNVFFSYHFQDSRASNPNSKAQLDLLARLISSGSSTKNSMEFRLNLFNTDEEES